MVVVVVDVVVATRKQTSKQAVMKGKADKYKRIQCTKKKQIYFIFSFYS